MTAKEFAKTFWSMYCQLEDEVVQTSRYVTFDTMNFSAFSRAYLKIYLSVCSEIDILIKMYCKHICSKHEYKNIDACRELIVNCIPDFSKTSIDIRGLSEKLSPWHSFDEGKNPKWWGTYNDIKHNRAGHSNQSAVNYYKLANQENILLSLCGLYQLEMFYYHDLSTSENKRVTVPIPASKILNIDGSSWCEDVFVADFAMYIESGSFQIEVRDF